MFGIMPVDPVLPTSKNRFRRGATAEGQLGMPNSTITVDDLLAAVEAVLERTDDLVAEHESLCRRVRVLTATARSLAARLDQVEARDRRTFE